MQPFYSVIVPLYNKERHIKKTLASALEQTFTDFEIIVIDDGSTDNGLQVVKSIVDERIRIVSTENQGVSKARNLGIEQAKGTCIAFLDADDSWFPNHLSSLKLLYDTYPDCGLYASAYNKIINERVIESEFSTIPNNQHWQGIVPDYFAACQLNCIAWTSAVMLPKKVLDAVGNFDETITLGAGEDTDLWIRIALQYKVVFSNQVTALHHLHSDNRLSNTNTNKRSFINLDKYSEAALNNSTLAKYLDMNRFSIGLQYRAAENNNKAKLYFDKIERSHLNFKQKLLMKCSSTSLSILKNIQLFLRRFNLNLSAFK